MTKKNETNKILVGILMGSDSDWPVMKAAADALTEFGIASEAKVISAHRTPRDLEAYASAGRDRGLRVFICGAGGAAHLPGMLAAIGDQAPAAVLDPDQVRRRDTDVVEVDDARAEAICPDLGKG